MGTPLYDRLDQHHMRQVWEGTPFMVDAFTGSVGQPRWREMAAWLTEKFGPQAYPWGGKAGRWFLGTATIHGWTWLGFDTQEALDEFTARWVTDETAVAG